ncbi:DUF4124 domain-containing protein [Pseudomonas viridiflava]|uniref:DUF4124 domain-containing protein n=1 Tax=Pseudomonas viridiflava TaxID=33069 RepID=A0A3M5P2L2_PSEVI|nr:DUF4124 domain-containing protein [Pseudomonas viridiflava]MBA1232834.1 DUF4124 domain-containing protein [Pseudomonas viridiflava]RMT78868.1 hypothetical protein ALP40_03144 [Pseudomonas viridiflava]
MQWMIVAAALAMAASASSQAAPIYKWVDAQGITHFDAQPPAGKEAQQINVQTPVPASRSPSSSAPERSDAAEQRAVDDKVKGQLKAQEAKLEENCENLRTNLAQLRNNPRVREQVGGEVRRLTEENRKTRIEETEKAISEYCR